MRKWKCLIYILLATVSLMGCVTQKQSFDQLKCPGFSRAVAQRFWHKNQFLTIKGRAVIRQNKEKYSLDFIWQRSGGENKMFVINSFGALLFKLYWNHADSWVIVNNQKYFARNSGELLEKLLNVSLGFDDLSQLLFDPYKISGLHIKANSCFNGVNLISKYEYIAKKFNLALFLSKIIVK